MSDGARRATADRLRILGKEKAIALVEALATDGETSVQGLADRIGASHQNASHHLSLLRQAGLVARRTDGATSIYALEDWAAWWVVRELADLLADTVTAARPEGPGPRVGRRRTGTAPAMAPRGT